MQSVPQPKSTLYESLKVLPERLTGEILDGQLHTHPRPAGPHVRVAYVVAGKIGPYDEDMKSGGPGGWLILVEPEVHFVRDIEVTVPDLAGWRREQMPYLPEGHCFEVVPDWVCEILSPATKSKDREVKLPLYVQYGVQYVWLVDPTKRTLEAYRLDAGAWVKIGYFADTDQVVVPPFEEAGFDLGILWASRRPVAEALPVGPD